MKIYKLKRGDKIKVEEWILTYHKMDGMYSLCTADWVKPSKEQTNIVNLGCGTELKRNNDWAYRLK